MNLTHPENLISEAKRAIASAQLLYESGDGSKMFSNVQETRL